MSSFIVRCHPIDRTGPVSLCERRGSRFRCFTLQTKFVQVTSHSLNLHRVRTRADVQRCLCRLCKQRGSFRNWIQQVEVHLAARRVRTRAACGCERGVTLSLDLQPNSFLASKACCCPGQGGRPGPAALARQLGRWGAEGDVERERGGLMVSSARRGRRR
eukprot:1437157-Prymnesium_polylepis.2